MLGRTSKTRGREDESGLSQPLLNSSEEDLPGSSNGTSLRSNGNVLFSVDDGSDDGSEELLQMMNHVPNQLLHPHNSSIAVLLLAIVVAFDVGPKCILAIP